MVIQTEKTENGEVRMKYGSYLYYPSWYLQPRGAKKAKTRPFQLGLLGTYYQEVSRRVSRPMFILRTLK